MGISPEKYATGQIKSKQVGNYQHEYYNNGRIKAVGQLNIDGAKEGEWKFYRKNGLLHKTEIYIDGKNTEKIRITE